MPSVEGLRKGTSSPIFVDTKGSDTMTEPDRSQWQIRCAFNGFCKRTLKNEAINAHRDTKKQQLYETVFSDLNLNEEAMLYTYDDYFTYDAEEKSFCVAGREITVKLLSEALESLTEEKRDAILLYYFLGMNDAEIARICNVSRSTVQYRRKRAFELLKMMFGRMIL